MKPQAITKGFQTELVQLMNKYTGGEYNKKVSARDRCRLAHDFQVYLLMAATKVLIPAGTKNAIESVIKSNCMQFERLQRMVYKADPEPTGESNDENPQPQSDAQTETTVADPVPSSSGEVQIISREEASNLGIPKSQNPKIPKSQNPNKKLGAK